MLLDRVISLDGRVPENLTFLLSSFVRGRDLSGSVPKKERIVEVFVYVMCRCKYFGRVMTVHLKMMM